MTKQYRTFGTLGLKGQVMVLIMVGVGQATAVYHTTMPQGWRGVHWDQESALVQQQDGSSRGRDAFL